MATSSALAGAGVQLDANKTGITSLGRSVDLGCWLAAVHLATIDSKKDTSPYRPQRRKNRRAQLGFEDRHFV